MKSVYIVFPEPNKIEVSEETVRPPEPGEVLCAAEKSLISIGTESYCLRGVFDPGTNWAAWVKYPFRPGYSMAARIVAVGKGVTGLKEGDRIATWIEHQQFFKLRPEQAYPIPEGISDEEATWAVLACTTQLGVRRAQLQLGETVGVVGLGMLGQLVTQYLAVAGARRIIAIDPVQGRLDRAKAHGATHTLALDVASARPEIEKITGGRLLDVVFDITGHPPVLAPAIQLLRRLGRVVLLGDTPNPTQQYLGPGVVSNSIAILGIHATARPDEASDFNQWSAQEMAALFFDYLLQGRMRVSDLVTHRYSPLDAPQVYEGLRRDRSAAIGVIFDWSLP
ncbi:MAG TPA: zinc-binding alcohol dehydrogenase [Anaerolineae bacterium]|nr:zinc-binding alcohol dehydrogenase [Anaerolineae bacterium]